MDRNRIDHIEDDPHYMVLVKKRNRLVWSLASIMIAVYFCFILFIAFSPESLGRPLGDGVVTVGIPVGIGVILFAFLLTGIYTFRANSEFDGLEEKIRERYEKGGVE